MDRRISWTKRAKQEFSEIIAWIEADSPDNGQRVAGKIFEKIELISKHPLIGHGIERLADSRVRYILAYKYRIVYRVFESRISILRIVHGARNFPKALYSTIE